ncbi:MAG: M16 family metallopeptidase [Clostridium sp.]
MTKLNFNVNRTKLKNGLEVITIKRDTQISSINVGIKVGGVDENINEKGISHFIEHMLFKGTETLNNEKLNYELESLGGEYNAYTDYASTVYTISCLGEEIINGINLLSDMIINPKFDSKELNKERGVILAEMRSSKDDVEDLSFKRVSEIGFDKSPLKYDVTGLEGNVKSFNRDDIKTFYKRYYTPDNSILTLVSNLEHNEAIEILENSFGKWDGKCLENRSVIYEKNNPVKEVTIKRDMEQSTIVYLYTFYHLDREDELPLRILNHRLGESANSLLFREIRENRGLAYDIYTHLDMTREVKTLFIYTSVSNEDIDETILAIDEVLAGVLSGKTVLGERDLTVMKKVHKTAVIGTLEDSGELCNYILHQALEDEDIYEFVKDMDRLNKISSDDIYKVSKKAFIEPTIHILKGE